MSPPGGDAPDDDRPATGTVADRLRAARSLQVPRPTSGRFRADQLPEELPEFLTGRLPKVVIDEDVVAAEPTDLALPVRELQPHEQNVFDALVDLGIGPAEARAAILQDRVPLVLTRAILDERPEYTIQEVADQVELDVETLRKLRAAQGLPETDQFSALDLQAAQEAASMLEVFNLETLIRSGRARGNAVGSIVMSDLSVVRDELILPLRRAGADDVTIAIALAEAMKAIEPTAREALSTQYQMQLRHMLSTEIAASAARSTTTALRVAVGFVDIVGFTRLSARIDPSGLDDLIDAFEGRVVEVVSSRPDVAVVKYLGDAVMLIGPDGCTLAEAMLELTTEIESLEDAPVRGGMAIGEVLVRDGDYFGPAVNLAARLTDLTRPWRLLVAQEDLEEVRRCFKVDRIRSTRLRGIGTTRPGVVQRPLTSEELAEVAAQDDAEALAAAEAAAAVGDSSD